jgi:hypothetical protein
MSKRLHALPSKLLKNKFLVAQAILSTKQRKASKNGQLLVVIHPQLGNLYVPCPVSPPFDQPTD